MPFLASKLPMCTRIYLVLVLDHCPSKNIRYVSVVGPMCGTNKAAKIGWNDKHPANRPKTNKAFSRYRAVGNSAHYTALYSPPSTVVPRFFCVHSCARALALDRLLCVTAERMYGIIYFVLYTDVNSARAYNICRKVDAVVGESVLQIGLGSGSVHCRYYRHCCSIPVYKYIVTMISIPGTATSTAIYVVYIRGVEVWHRRTHADTLG